MTIKEIAQLCGVSRGTVDRVINRRGRVSPEVETRVLETLRQVGYTKNYAARALRVKGEAPVIGLMLSAEGNPFFDEVIRGARQASAELADYGVTLRMQTMRGYCVEEQLRLVEHMRGEISALALQPVNDERVRSLIDDLAEEGVPTVTVNSDIEQTRRVCYVGSDYLAGGRTAAGLVKLATGGQASLGVISGVRTLLGHEQRLRGFQRRLAEIAPGVRCVAVESAMDDAEHSYRVTFDMLTAHPEVDALFVVAAGTTGVCRAVLACGREERVRVLAFDDVPETVDMMRRGLVKAVVCQQPFQQGYRAVRAAFDAFLARGVQPRESIIMENQIKILENVDTGDNL